MSDFNPRKYNIGSGPNMHFSKSQSQDNFTDMFFGGLINKTFLLHVLLIIVFAVIYFVAISNNPQQWQIDTNPKKPSTQWDKLSAACYNATIVQTSLGFGSNIPTIDNHWGKVIIIIQSLIALYITVGF